MTWQNVIFDLDGTLTDSKEGIEKSILFTLSELGYPPPEEKDLSWAVGPPIHGIMARLIGPVSDSRIEEAVNVFRSRYTEIGYREARVFPGVRSLLTHLETSGRNLFVCTSKKINLARRVLDHFELAPRFKAVYGSVTGFESKEGLLTDMLERERLEPGCTVMVGDRKYDIQAALANRLAGIGVGYGYGSGEELRRAGAGIICQTLGELADVLTGPA